MPAALKPLHQQVIVITGATSGIRLVTAYLAARAGAAVVLAARNDAALRNAVHELRKTGTRAIHAVCDVGREEDAARVAAAAETEFGGFDIWVNNAGVSISGKLSNVPVAAPAGPTSDLGMAT